MKNRTDYKTCEFCGCSLDVGELCDCRQLEQDQESEARKIIYIFTRPETIKGGSIS